MITIVGMILRLIFLVSLIGLNNWAAVVRLNVVERQDVENRREFGPAGPYGVVNIPAEGKMRTGTVVDLPFVVP